MADEVAQVRLPDGTVVWARVAGADRLARGGEPAHGDEDDFSDTGFGGRLASAVEGIPELVRGVAASLREATSAVAPDQVSVEFGIDLTAAPGKVVGLLANAEAKAAIKVTLTWQEPAPRGAGAGPHAAVPAQGQARGQDQERAQRQPHQGGRGQE